MSDPKPSLPALAPVCLGALLFGVVLCMLTPMPLPVEISGVGLLAGLLLWWKAVRWRWLGALLAGFAWASMQVAMVLSSQLPPSLEKQELRVSGRVLDLPQHEVRRTWFLFKVDDDRAQPKALRGRRIRLSWYDDFRATQPGPRLKLRAGSCWQFSIKARAPRGLANPGGFDTERHALSQRISATAYVRNPRTAVELATARGIPAWREALSMRIQAQVTRSSSRFVRALALGDTRDLSDQDWEQLRATGLTHLIAISGFHVGLVAMAFAMLCGVFWRSIPGLMRWLPLPQATGIAALVGAGLYAAAVGFGLPTVRTVLMLAVVVVARLGRRPVRVLDALALAMAVMLLLDPLAVLTVGFWLSFAGVAWLAWSLPRTSQHWLKGFLSAQAVATIGLLPLTVVLFGQASLAGVLANLVAIPWWSLVVVPLCLIGVLLEVVHAGAGSGAWRAAASCFDLSWPLFQRMADSPFALWWLPEPGRFALVLALLAAFWWLLPRGVPGKSLAALLWLPLLWPDRELPQTGELELTVIDVGQGLSVLVRTRHHSLLYDAGPVVRDGFDAGERAVVPALRALGVRRLDAMVVSHGDSDHAGGTAAVQRVFPVPQSWAPVGSPVAGNHHCQTGQTWQWDGVRFRFLHPTPHFPYLANESSCVLRIESAHGVALLTGDIGEVVERGLLRLGSGDVRADVVVAAHHGSRNSSTPAFVNAAQARLVLVSSGHGNHFGHPHAQVVERWQRSGAEVLQTGQGGALRVWLGKQGLAVRERRQQRRHLWDAAQRGLSYRPEDMRPDVPKD